MKGLNVYQFLKKLISIVVEYTFYTMTTIYNIIIHFYEKPTKPLIELLPIPRAVYTNIGFHEEAYSYRIAFDATFDPNMEMTLDKIKDTILHCVIQQINHERTVVCVKRVSKRLSVKL